MFKLRKRELEARELLMLGYDRGETARLMGISKSTLSAYIHAILIMDPDFSLEHARKRLERRRRARLEE